MRHQLAMASLTTESIALDPVLDFMRLLWNVEHGLQSRSKWMEATLGITGPQRLVLRVVRDRPGLSPGELSRILHLHPSTITGVLQRLVKKGLLQRTRDRSDSRRIQLRARPAAQRFMSPSDVTVEAAVKRALTILQPHRVRQAREVLTVIADMLVDSPDDGFTTLQQRRRHGRKPGRTGANPQSASRATP